MIHFQSSLGQAVIWTDPMFAFWPIVDHILYENIVRRVKFLWLN